MAIPWIKIETSLPRKPEVMQLAAILDIDEFAVVGHLVCFWSWVDENLSLECPVVTGTKRGLDRVAGRDGFADAMVTVGWLQMEGSAVSIPHLEYHLDQGAKTRAMEQRKKAKQRKTSGRPTVSGKCPDDIGTKTGTTAGPEERRLEKKEKERPGGSMDLQFPTHLHTPEALAAAEQWFDYLDRTGLDARSPRGDEISLRHWWANVGDDFVDSDSMVRAVSFSIAGNYLNLNAKKGTGKRVAEASSEDWLKVRKVIQQYPSRSESDTLKRREHLTKQQQEAVKRTGRENISTMTQFNETRIREVFENHLKDITNGQ
jgi:hypothetical protein